MRTRYIPGLSIIVVTTIGAIGMFVMGFAYGYQAGNP